MWSFAVIFRQPFFLYFPYFIHYSEQIKIEYFCTVPPVKTLNESILRWFAWPDKFQLYGMLLRPFGKYQRDEFRAVIHAKHDGISPAGCAPVSTRTTCRAGRFRSVSIDNASRLKSSTTLNVRKPDHKSESRA